MRKNTWVFVYIKFIGYPDSSVFVFNDILRKFCVSSVISRRKMITIARKLKQYDSFARMYTSKTPESSTTAERFETVYTFPHIKYFAVYHRLKVYHIIGSSIAIPGCGVLEMLNAMPHQSCLTAAIIGITGAGVLSAASWPLNNMIGFLYISEDNKYIKISSMNFWGKRVDRIVPADDWIPLLDMAPKTMDILYLSPELSDKTKYKWFVKFGNVLNSKKIGEVLE